MKVGLDYVIPLLIIRSINNGDVLHKSVTLSGILLFTLQEKRDVWIRACLCMHIGLIIVSFVCRRMQSVLTNTTEMKIC